MENEWIGIVTRMDWNLAFLPGSKSRSIGSQNGGFFLVDLYLHYTNYDSRATYAPTTGLISFWRKIFKNLLWNCKAQTIWCLVCSITIWSSTQFLQIMTPGHKCPHCGAYQLFIGKSLTIWWNCMAQTFETFSEYLYLKQNPTYVLRI